MSNSSNVNETFGGDVPAAPLVRLLLAMSGEWTRIADDLNRLGAAVSTRAMAESDLANAVELQAFDMIQQRAQGQASLLAKLARKIDDDHVFDRKRLDELLEDIPFHSIRGSLAGAFDGRSDPLSGQDKSDEIDWL